MSKDEKLLILQLILEDIRGNWNYGVSKRLRVALELAEELERAITVSSIKEYRERLEAGSSIDGRYFRKHYVDGGYQNMKELHGLDNVMMDRSAEFQSVAESVLTYPQARFRDWDEYLELEQEECLGGYNH